MILFNTCDNLSFDTGKRLGFTKLNSSFEVPSWFVEALWLETRSAWLWSQTPEPLALLPSYQQKMLQKAALWTIRRKAFHIPSENLSTAVTCPNLYPNQTTGKNLPRPKISLSREEPGVSPPQVTHFWVLCSHWLILQGHSAFSASRRAPCQSCQWALLGFVADAGSREEQEPKLPS